MSYCNVENASATACQVLAIRSLSRDLIFTCSSTLNNLFQVKGFVEWRKVLLVRSGFQRLACTRTEKMRTSSTDGTSLPQDSTCMRKRCTLRRQESGSQQKSPRVCPTISHLALHGFSLSGKLCCGTSMQPRHPAHAFVRRRDCGGRKFTKTGRTSPPPGLLRRISYPG